MSGAQAITHGSSLGSITLPALTEGLDVIWELIFDISERVPLRRWQLIGGQMVMLHGLVADRIPLRASRDVDVLADLLTGSDGLQLLMTVIRELHFEPVRDSDDRHIYRFTRAHDNSVVDVLAPDHSPPRWPLRTVSGKDTIRIDGGNQALQRPAFVNVTKGSRQKLIPIPDHFGALVLKAAAWLSESRDRERHSGDAAFLISLMRDPIHERSRFAGSDRKRLNALNSVLGDPSAMEWAVLGPFGPDAYTTWQLLLA